MKHGQANRKRTTPEYSAWLHMKDRCLNPKNKMFSNYGGRGISVCERWINSFQFFFEDMGKKPTSKHSIDRIDNDGNYEPSNCRWATYKTQLRNNRRNRWYEYNGNKMVLQDWADKWGINYQLIQSLLKYGSSFEDIYKRFELGEYKKKKRKPFEKRSDSRTIYVVVNNAIVRTYPSISVAVKEEKVNKKNILDHLNGYKYLYDKKTKGKRKIPIDYSKYDKVFKTVL